MLPFPGAVHRQEPETLELAPLPSAIIMVSLDAPWRQESDVVSWNHAHLQGGEYHWISWNHAHLQGGEYHWIHWNREQKSPKCLHGQLEANICNVCKCLHLLGALDPAPSGADAGTASRPTKKLGMQRRLGEGTFECSHTVLFVRARCVSSRYGRASHEPASLRSHWHCYIHPPDREVRTHTMPPPASRKQP